MHRTVSESYGGWSVRAEAVFQSPPGDHWKKKSTCHFLTFILKCNETQGKVDPGVIILYNIPGDSFQKVILAVSKYQYQKQGRKSECCCWLWLSGVGDVGPAAKVCVLRGKNYLPEWGIALSQPCQYNRKLP